MYHILHIIKNFSENTSHIQGQISNLEDSIFPLKKSIGIEMRNQTFSCSNDQYISIESKEAD